MQRVIRIGTRESQLAVWQATLVQDLLARHGAESQLVYVKSEGDIDLVTPLYEIGVQGIFTRSLDIALLNNSIDIAVHSMKDVPTQMPAGITNAAVLERASYLDILVYNGEKYFLENPDSQAVIATSSIRRRAQWLHKYPNHHIENLRGNVNTRLRKTAESHWNGAIFAAAGLERIHLRPDNSIDLDWMLPAPAQGAIVVVARASDEFCREICQTFNHQPTAVCTQIERDFLRALMGGCSTPISALAKMQGDEILFEGNIVSPNGLDKAEIKKSISPDDYQRAGAVLAQEILENGGRRITEKLHNA